MTDDEKAIVDSWFLLTDKPVIYAANIADSDIGPDMDEIPYVKAVREVAQAEGAQVFTVSAQIEEEIAQMDPEEKQEFLNELGLGQSGLDRLITACYSLLGLISFLTAGADECRAWTIVNGTKAPQAAGKIHTDFAQRGQGLCDEGRRHCAVPLQRINSKEGASYVQAFFFLQKTGAHGLEGHVADHGHFKGAQRQKPPLAFVRHAPLRAEIQRGLCGL